jgi:S1-C subfamily serine protease
MQRATLYSSSRRPRSTGGPDARPAEVGDARPAGGDGAAPAAPALRARWRGFRARHERPLLVAAGAVLVALLVALHGALAPKQRPLTQKDIDAAVLQTLETTPLPSVAAKAYAVIAPAVVRVRGLGAGREGMENAETGVGTGVVIVDKGIILTNLHVVVGAERVGVVFADGLETDADVIGVQPENDLAVIQAKKIPDDLVAATLRSTADLAPGDVVVAVGFPFGIGPSASAGVISGLGREYQSPRGKRILTNLIQFDAAANPGNSGGPLVTADGEVVGIVTGILNPNQQRTFVGIGFAVPIENAAAAIGLSPF